MNRLLTRECECCGVRVPRWSLTIPRCSVREALGRVGLLARFYPDGNAMERMGK